MLSRRMQRQKVNGNGIRAAGNPDEEPILSRFPSCPPVAGVSATTTTEPIRCVAMIKVLKSRRLKDVEAAKDCTEDSPSSSKISIESVVRSGNSSSSCKNGPQEIFPLKLQRILDKLESDGITDVLSWQPHGRAFRVRDSDRFVNEILPLYFNQTKYSSFQRQCHMYHLTRITQAGPDKGAYFNVNFQRGRPELSLTMQRTRVNGKGTRRPGNPEREPDFRTLMPLPTIPLGTRIDIPLDVVGSGMDL